MKKTLVLFFILVSAFTLLSSETVKLNNADNSVEVISSSETETVLQYNISKYVQTPVKIEGNEWFALTLPKEGMTQDKGYPQLPVYNRSIIIPDNAFMNLEVYDVQFTDVNIQVAPSKGVITRNIDPETVPYTFNEVYQINDFYPETLATLSEPYILRDFRGITVRTVPFAYNPVTKTLRIYTSYKIRVYKEGLDYRNVITSTRNKISREFSTIYENHFLNWNSYRYTPVDDSFGKLLVICHTNYMSAILPYVNWKIQKGIETELVQFSSIGTTAAQLQTYIANYYNTNGLTYVQLVGDAAQIPSLSSGGGGSDPSFSLIEGFDNYPDIFIGRFSAESTADVTAQINKAIAYERDLNTTATWLTQAMGISDQATTAGDDGETDIQHMNNIRALLIGNGYTSVDQIYEPTATAAQVTTNVNAGRGFINYVGHGSNTSWVTTGFSNTNASALTNGNKTPFIMDVACVNGNFVSYTCFAEAWLRNANGGAVAMYASSINQYWNEPMEAQDEVTNLLVSTHDPLVLGDKTTVGGLFYNGSCSMMDSYGSSGVDMFKTWHIFGDASLLARTKTPIAMSVTHPAQIVIGTTTVNVSTGVAYALVGISYNNTYKGSSYTNSSGNATITLIDPPTTSMNYTITVTAFNRITYIGSIQQVPGSGPFLTVTGQTYSDSNNNTPEYNETGQLNVTFHNLGSETATNVVATLSCSTPGITITDNTETITTLAAGASTTLNNAYAISIANNIANGTSADFIITMVGSDTWTHSFNLTIFAPALAFGSMMISDPSPGNGNGMLDPGETVTITMPLNNTGAAASPSGNATLTCGTTGITINTGATGFPAIAASGNATLSFNLTADAGMTEGTLASLVFAATAGAYTANTTVNVEVGAPAEIIIGSGTSTQTYPLDRYYNYSTHESIYLASEIGMAGSIKSIGFYKSSGTDVNAITAVTIYMKNTTSSSLSTGTYSTTGYTQVFSGSFPNSATSGWMEVDLDTMFAYDGVSNLSILIVKGYQAWIYEYPYWTYTTSASSRARQSRNDDAQPTSLTASTYLPNLKLKIYSSSSANPTISVNPASVSESLESGSSSNHTVTVTNTGTADLNWSIQGRELVFSSATERSIAGSTLTCSASQYTPGATGNWTFTVYNASTDSEWLEEIYITFPAGVTVNSATNFTGGSGGDLAPDLTSGTGITINWYDIGGGTWGVIYPAESATATVNVTVSASFSGDMTLPYQIVGDIYGAEPHTLTGNMVLTQSGGTPSTWFSASPTSGTVTPGGNTNITIHFDTAGLADGTYNSNLVINSNAANNPSLSVPLSLTVYTAQNPYPDGPRFVAEWEPATGAIVRYPLGLPYTVLADMSNNGLLYVVVTTANQSACNTSLSSNGVNMTNVRYINAATDTYWIRDYGPWTIFDSSNNMKIVDFTYNRPRPNDDAIPGAIADYLGIDYYTMPLVATGGNIMCDGKAAAMSTQLILEENPTLTEAEIDEMAENYLGVTDYQFYTDPNNTYIDHIDCWAKLLDVDKVIIRSVPVSHAQYDEIEATVDEWEAKTSGYGTPYQIFRVYTPNDEPYTNSYIMNKKIYVPIMNSTNDAAALASYQAAMPGYTIVGYYYSTWESTDALHCRVNTVFDDQMIHVWHVPPTSANAGGNVTINVDITHHNSLSPTETYVAWKTSLTGNWQFAPLTQSARETWTANLTAPGLGETIYYYIKATDTTGRNTTLPLCAGNDPFTLLVDTLISLEAPVVTITHALEGTVLQWNEVASADEYDIYRSTEPYGTYSLIGTTDTLQYTDEDDLTQAFYYVKAVAIPAARKEQ